MTGEGIERFNISGLTIGQLIGRCEDFCKAYTERHGGYIDYIHGDCECVEMAQRFGCAGILLPRMEKSELFGSVMKSGPFPKKAFPSATATISAIISSAVRYSDSIYPCHEREFVVK